MMRMAEPRRVKTTAIISLSSSPTLTHRSSPPRGNEAVQIGRPSNILR